MVSKGNFQHGGRANQLQQRTGSNIRCAIAPYRKPRILGNEMSFSSSCQMPSDPLYIDFNNPAPAPQHRQNAGSCGDSVGGLQQQQKKKGLKGKPKTGSKPMCMESMNGNCDNGVANWRKHHRNIHDNRFNGAIPRGNVGVFNPMHMMGGPSNRGGRHMIHPMGVGSMRGGPMAPHPALAFQPPMPPMRGPVPPMGLHPPPPPHFMRRNGRPGGGGHIIPIPPPIPPMYVRPRMSPRGLPPHLPFNPRIAGNGSFMAGNNSGKIKKPNVNLIKQAVKGKSTIKTLKNLVNQYPIDKPWVTSAIRAEHDKKIDIENRLKGNKDDHLFAQFKVQRDKFVAMYEEARENYLKQEAATVMAKDAKDKNTNSNKSGAAKGGNSKEAIPNPKLAKNQTKSTEPIAEQQQETQEEA